MIKIENLNLRTVDNYRLKIKSNFKLKKKLFLKFKITSSTISRHGVWKIILAVKGFLICFVGSWSPAHWARHPAIVHSRQSPPTVHHANCFLYRAQLRQQRHRLRNPRQLFIRTLLFYHLHKAYSAPHYYYRLFIFLHT